MLRRIQPSQPVISWPTSLGPLEQGERVEILFPGGATYQGQVTSGREIYLKKKFREYHNLNPGDLVEIEMKKATDNL